MDRLDDELDVLCWLWTEPVAAANLVTLLL